MPGDKPGGGYEPDWTEEELEEKLNALRARRGGDKSARLDADLRKHGIELDLDTPYARGETNRFEPLDGEEEGKDAHEWAMERLQVLMEAREWEEIEDLAKAQIIVEPEFAKAWRKIGKTAAKARRLQRPRVVRFLLALVKAVVAIFTLLVVAVIAGAIIGAFLHH